MSLGKAEPSPRAPPMSCLPSPHSPSVSTPKSAQFSPRPIIRRFRPRPSDLHERRQHWRRIAEAALEYDSEDDDAFESDSDEEGPALSPAAQKCAGKALTCYENLADDLAVGSHGQEVRRRSGDDPRTGQETAGQQATNAKNCAVLRRSARLMHAGVSRPNNQGPKPAENKSRDVRKRSILRRRMPLIHSAVGFITEPSGQARGQRIESQTQPPWLRVDPVAIIL